MNPRTLMILAGVTAAVAAGAYFVARAPSPRAADSSKVVGKAFLPDLGKSLTSVTVIEVKDATKKVTIQRADSKSPWVVVEKYGFPASDMVRPIFTVLNGMTVIDEKTSKPERYGAIGVADLDKPGSTAKLVTLKDAGGKDVAAVLVGNTGDAGAPGSRDGSLYVRRVGEAQSYQVSGSLTLETDPMSWVDKTVLQLERNRVKSVTVTRFDDPGYDAADPAKTNVMEAFRENEKDLNFKVRNLPPGRELTYEGAADQPTNPLGYLAIDDVRPREQVDFTKMEGPGLTKPPAGQKAPLARAEARYVCFDGLVLTVKVTKQDGKAWLAIDAAFDEKEIPAAKPEEKKDEKAEGAKKDEPKKDEDPAGTRKKPEDVKKEVDELNAKHGKWAYAVPDYAATQIATRLEELLKPPAPAKQAGPEPAGPQTPTPEDNILVPEGPGPK